MALSKLLFSKRTISLFKKLVVYWVLLTLPLFSLAQPALAQGSPPQNLTAQSAPTTNPQPKTSETLNGSQTSRYSQQATSSATASDTNGKVLLFGLDPCDLDPTGVCDKITGIPADIVNFILGQMLKIVTKIFFSVLKLIIGILGFSIETLLSACGTIFDQFQDITSGSIVDNSETPSTGSNLNALVLLDVGVSGVYKAVPDNGPVQTLNTAFQQNVLGIQTVNAQGEGTDDLGDGVRKIWEKIRDAALILMVLVLVVIGFMVMLRKRLDPRTVVTATNALPRIALSLILIVFSFAISGLFIDLIYIMIGIVRNAFGGFLGFVSSNLGGELIWFPLFSAFSMSSVINWQQLICTAGGLPILAGGPFGLLAMLFAIMLIEFFVRLILVIVGFYLFWILVKNYAYMVIYTIFSPLFFLLGAIPGYEGIITTWFKRMLAYALAFPVIVIFIYIALGLLSQSGPRQLWSDDIGSPPPIESNVLNISYLLAIGIIFFATKVPQFLEKMFKIDGTDIRGGLGVGLLALPVTGPVAAGRVASKASGLAGAALPLTGRFVDVTRPGTFAGGLADRLHNTARAVGGDTSKLASDASGSKTYTRTAQERRNEYFTQGRSGEAVGKDMKEARATGGEAAASHGPAGTEGQMSGRTEGGVNVTNIEPQGTRNVAESQQQEHLTREINERLSRGEINEATRDKLLRELYKKLNK